MANTAILEIDTKFLQNIQQAEQSLKAAAQQARLLTSQFNAAVQSGGDFSAQLGKIATGLSNLNLSSANGLSAGVLKIGEDARNADDRLKLLNAQLDKVKETYKNFVATEKHTKKGQGRNYLRITDEKDLESVAKLKEAIRSIDASLRQDGKKKLSPVDRDYLQQQKTIYQDAINVLNRNDRQRTEVAVKEVNERVKAIKQEANAQKALADSHYTSSPKNAIGYAKQAKSVEELTKAEKYLTEVRDKQNSKTQAGKRNFTQLNEQIAAVKRQREELTVTIQQEIKYATAIARTSKTAEQLTNALNYLNEVKARLGQPTSPADIAQLQTVEAAIDKVIAKRDKLSGTTTTGASEYLTSKDARAAVDAAKNLDTTKMSAQELKKKYEEISAIKDKINPKTSAGQAQIKELSQALDALKAKMSDPKTSISFAQNANTLSDLKQAVKDMEAAKQKVPIDTKEGRRQVKELNKEIDRTNNKIRSIEGSSTKANSSVSRIAQTMRNAFSVHILRQFSNQLVTVFGNFQMIQRSLEVLVGNSAKAEMIWDRIAKLALKSPFQIQQLTTTAKQLAAYRVETDLLYRKTKMLAEISAGLGVEMSRLVLAYGQVKAANFLRGTELRQFSEAGVDMLGELSSYFSEVEGQAVSVAEVFERISKRQVLFEDVDEVLTRITSVGGAFYKMQEQQAETVRGQISNLKDQISIAFMEMGESSEGIITDMISLLKTLIENWRVVLQVFAPLLLGIASYKAGIVLATIATKTWRAITMACSVAMKLFTSGLNSATTAINAFSVASKISGFGVILGIIGAVVAAFSSFNVKATDARIAVSGVGAVFAEEASNVRSLTVELNAVNDAIDAAAENEDELARLTATRSNILSELSRVNADYANSLREVINAGGDLADVMERINDEASSKEDLAAFFATLDVDTVNEAADRINRLQAAQGISPSSFFRGEDVGTKIAESFGELYNFYAMDSQVRRAVAWAAEQINEAQEKSATLEAFFSELNQILNEMDERLPIALGSDYDKGDYGDLLSHALSGYEYNMYTGLTSTLDAYEADMEKLTGAINSMIESARDDDYVGELVRAVTAEPDPELKEQAQRRIQGYFSDILNALELDGQALEDAQNRIAEELWSGEWIQFPEDLLPWQERYNAFLTQVLSDADKTPEVAAGVNRLFGTISNNTTTAKDMADNLKGLREEYERIIATTAEQAALPEDERRYTDEDLRIANEYLSIVRLLEKWFNLDKNKGKRKENLFSDAAKSIEDVHRSFLEMRKVLSEDASRDGAWARYSDAVDTALQAIGSSAADVRRRFGDLTDEASFLEALEWLRSRAATRDERFEIDRMIGEYRYEVELARDKESFEAVQSEIENLFEGYELGVELGELHIPNDFAQLFFDVETPTIEELRQALFARAGEFEGTEEVKAYKEWLKKLDELEIESQQRRLREYIEFAREAIGERAKVMLDGFYQMKDIEDSFTLTNSWAHSVGYITEDIKTSLEQAGKSISDVINEDLWSVYNIDDANKENILAAHAELMQRMQDVTAVATERMNEELQQLDWDAFRGSDTFRMLFNDLSSASGTALTMLIEKLEEYKEEWTDLPLTEMREMVKLLEEAREAQALLNSPIEGIRASMTAIQDSDFSTKADAEEAMFNSETEIANLERQLAIVEMIATLRSEGVTEDEIRTRIGEEYEYLLIQTTDEIRTQIRGQRDLNESAREYLGNLELVSSFYKEISNRADKIKEGIDKIVSGWASVNDIFGDETLSRSLSDMVDSIATSAVDGIKAVAAFKEAKLALDIMGEGASKFGEVLNASMGIIGLIVAALQIVVAIIKAIVEQHDKRLQKQIDAEILKVEALQKAYEKLANKIDEAFTALSLAGYTREAQKNLETQIRATERMIALEEAKKKTDKDAIKEWKDNIENMKADMEALSKDAFSTLTDGVIDSVLDTTRQFVDAWHEAYEETGDGMKGLEDNFTDMLKGMLRQQATMQLISPFIDRYKAWLNEYVNVDDPTLTPEEAAVWAERVRETFPELNNLLQGWFDSTQSLIESGGELSDLQKGIQGITEDQAEVLAAYWNSCRFMLSNIDTTLSRLADATLSTGGTSNPVLSELKTQTELMRRINSAIESVIGYGNGVHAGAYLKVYM